MPCSANFVWLAMIRSTLLCVALMSATASVWAQTTVIIAHAQERAIGGQREVLGSLLANESVAISATVSDVVARIAFEEGAAVQAGDILIELEHAAESAAVRAAQATRAEAQAALKRLRTLKQRDLSAQSELDLAEARFLAADAAVDQARAALNDRIIRAPFSGVLGLRDVSPGAYISAGDTITTLHDLSAMKIDFQVPEDALGLLRPGESLTARIPSLGNAKFAVMPDVDAVALTPQSRSLRVRAWLQQSEPRLRPGALAVIELHSTDNLALSVPEAALIPHQGRQTVYVVEDGQVSRREVTSGRRATGWVEIRSGLSAGEQVVIHGGAKLRPEAEVKVLGIYDGQTPIAEMIRHSGAAS